ncbi:MAG: hypothetical protein CV081_12165 [Nitrospira sp. LK265]|nr:hypothetical protein [Nitrospira sp. LK265]
MLQKIVMAVAAILTAILLSWAAVNASVGMQAPDISNLIWLNSKPLHPPDLKGNVVMIEFWIKQLLNEPS